MTGTGTATGRAEPSRAARLRSDPAVALWAVAGVCWGALLTAVLAAGDGGVHTHGGHGAGGHAHLLLQPGLPWAVRAAAFLGAWVVMLGAMMLPTLVPLARLFTVVTAGAPHRGRVRAGFYGGYLGVWAATAPVALAVTAGVQLLVRSQPWLGAREPLVLGTALLLAGGYQFSGLKDACLTSCRSAASMLWQHYGRGVRPALRLGVHAGIWCVGCCWALMLLMLVTGAASAAWMLGLTAVMVAEKTARRGARLVRPVGWALLLAGVLVTSAGLFPPGTGG